MTEVNLQAVKTFLNKVSNYRTLFACEDFDGCIVVGFESKTLIANIYNLKNLLNSNYKYFLVTTINNAAYDKEDENFNSSLTAHVILNM